MTSIRYIIDRYKHMRSINQLRQVPIEQYAFVGFGNHSTSNLYPVLDYLHVPLKYICCKSEDKVQLIKTAYPHIHVTLSLQELLDDEEVKGVFISISPYAHYETSRLFMTSGKALFIEKPPCSSLAELKKLMEQEHNLVVVGMQKRYAPVTKILTKRLKKERLLTYNLRYLTGGYPEGKPLTDLFIHPLDYVCYLFGKADICNTEYIQSKTGVTLLLTLKHKAITGVLELSTAYSWQNAIETLTVNTEGGIYELKQMETLTFMPTQGQFWGIPLEKVIQKCAMTETLFSRNNFVPTIMNNQIYTQGYYHEIELFVESVQKGSRFSPYTGFHSIYNTYLLIDEINKFINK